jgi:small basic protein
MNNIEKKIGGFIFNSLEYTFEDITIEAGIVSNEIISTSQVLVGTNLGVIMLDLSCTIDEVEYTDINQFVENLYN